MKSSAKNCLNGIKSPCTANISNLNFIEFGFQTHFERKIVWKPNFWFGFQTILLLYEIWTVWKKTVTYWVFEMHTSSDFRHLLYFLFVSKFLYFHFADDVWRWNSLRRLLCRCWSLQRPRCPDLRKWRPSGKLDRFFPPHLNCKLTQFWNSALLQCLKPHYNFWLL